MKKSRSTLNRLKKPMDSSAHKISKTSGMLLRAATRVRRNAYAPYSQFQVGAALIDEKGAIHIGCNAENSSYGGTICAERAALCAMVSSGSRVAHEIVVVTDLPIAASPCGMCLQVLLEFAPSGGARAKSKATPMVVHLANLSGIQRSFTLEELLPHSFDGAFLRDPKKVL